MEQRRANLPKNLQTRFLPAPEIRKNVFSRNEPNKLLILNKITPISNPRKT
jgi:hypothetical protein